MAETIMKLYSKIAKLKPVIKKENKLKEKPMEDCGKKSANKPKSKAVPSARAPKSSATGNSSTASATNGSIIPPVGKATSAPKPAPPTSIPMNNVPGDVKRKTVYQHRPRVLLVGDSLAQNLEFRKVEVVTNTTVKSAKAYSSV